MDLTELATAVTYNVPLTIVVMNNSVLGMVRQLQNLFYNKVYSNTTLDRKTDFVKLAEAFGAKGFRASNEEEFRNVFEEAYKLPGPAVIDLLIDKDELVLPMLKPGGTFDHLILDREDKA